MVEADLMAIAINVGAMNHIVRIITIVWNVGATNYFVLELLIMTIVINVEDVIAIHGIVLLLLK